MLFECVAHSLTSLTHKLLYTIPSFELSTFLTAWFWFTVMSTVGTYYIATVGAGIG